MLDIFLETLFHKKNGPWKKFVNINAIKSENIGGLPPIFGQKIIWCVEIETGVF